MTTKPETETPENGPPDVPPEAASPAVPQPPAAPQPPAQAPQPPAQAAYPPPAQAAYPPQPQAAYLPPAQAAYPPPPPASPMQKTPALAALLSFMPGLGNVYNGLYQRGIMFFLIFISLIYLGGAADNDVAPIFAGCAAFFWFFNIFDAYRQAKLLNHGLASEPMPDPEVTPSRFAGGLGLGVVLIAIGLLGVLNLFGVPIERILEQWPWALIAFGGWMVFQAIRARVKNDDDTESSDDELEAAV